MMYAPLLTLPMKQNVLLFSARNTGKSTLVARPYEPESPYWVDLLDPLQESEFAENPAELKAIVDGLPDEVTHVVIDEVQKIPKLFDAVHQLIESTRKKFILVGLSARKLNYGNAN